MPVLSIGYPVLVVLIGLVRNKKGKKGDYAPRVTILIAAYHEEQNALRAD
jgi:cellulose synthase/poly-beta-1,6-N-acetylglucosamine synthase-like glycosyltransferase